MSTKHPGRAIRKARRSIEMRLRELAAAIGRSKAYVCRVERGYIPAKPEEIMAMKAAIRAHAAARKSSIA